MLSLWNDAEATAIQAQEGELGLRVYSSRLLGKNPNLVLHGGGNTSLKGTSVSVFGDEKETLYVKGSGWDLRTIEAAGFPPVAMEHLLRLGELDSLSDTQMMRELRLALLDPTAPTPSVEAILHGLIPLRYVDHTHTDAVVTLSNSADGAARLTELYGSEVLILPYVMPGFVLAKQVAQATKGLDWSTLRGIVLLNHGLFTFADDAKTSYNAMIDLVSRAEQCIAANLIPKPPASATAQSTPVSTQGLARLRRSGGECLGAPALLRLSRTAVALEFAARSDAASLIASGPLTPDHTIHTKPFGAVFSDESTAGIGDFADRYRGYYAAHARAEHQRLDVMPRFGVLPGRGVLSLAPSLKKLAVVSDIVEHTLRAQIDGMGLGGWQALPQADLFEVEYWELEQAKLNSSPASADPCRELEGKVAVITGAYSGIGHATATRLLAAGAVVIALDNNPAIESRFAGNAAVMAKHCDVRDSEQVSAALSEGVGFFGGVDILVCNAGLFPPSQKVEGLEDGTWDASLDVNLTAPMRLLRQCVPLLKYGFDPAVVMIGSKNVPAPGPGAAAYSVAKAGLTQLARVAALELGQLGIRVNTLHPDAVYDTALWTDALLADRAAAYGMSVEEYKTKNVLGTEVRSADVAEAVFLLAGNRLGKTTGAQLPIDGGNERVL